MEIFLSLIIVNLISGGFASHVAASKGYDSGSWFALGVLFGPIALLSLAAMPDRRLLRYVRAIAEKQGVELGPIDDDNRGPDSPLGENEFIGEESDSKEQIWELVVARLSPDKSATADFNSSWFYRNLITVRSSTGDQIARAIGTPQAFGKKRWRVEL